jgi:hypothetical protein
MVVTGTYSDGTTAVIPNESLQFKNPGGNGAKNAIISYVGATATVTTTCPITNVVGATNRVGASDFSSAWWTAFSNKYSVASGATKTFTMKCYSTGANNWNAPLVILRKANMAEYAVVRMDNYGWGDNYNADGRSNDWDFAVLAQNINNSTVKIAVTNLGDGNAKVRYTVTYATGEVHFQEYSNIAIDANNLNATITIDGCYVDITSVE